MASRKTPLLYLASQSPRRRELLKGLRIRFKILLPKAQELSAPPLLKGDPAKVVARIAAHKAEEAAARLKNRKGEALVLAADTLVFLGQKILGKPANPAGARQMLQSLRGKEHTVATGVTFLFVRDGKILGRKTRVVKSRVKFARYSKALIRWYVATGEPLDKAGAYGAQGAGTVLIERIRGSYTNIVGLPLAETMELLAETAGRPWQDWCR